MKQLSLFGEAGEGLRFKVDEGNIVTNAKCGPTPPGSGDKVCLL